MFWISFYFSFALAQEPSVVNPSSLWSNEQIVQESLPILQGENLSLQSQIDTKVAFFQGESTFDSAFWQWKSEDILNTDVLNALRISILAQNQERLQKRFEVFPFIDPTSQAATDYKRAYELSWELQNELDALNLKAISILNASMSKYSELYTDLKNSESQWLQQSTVLMSDETQQSAVAEIVLERQKILDLHQKLIGVLATEKADINLLVREVLSEKAESSIELEGRLQRLEIIQSIEMESSLLQQVNEELNRLQNIQTEKDKAKLLEEFEVLKETWEDIVFGWDTERIDQEIQSLVIQKKHVSGGNTDLIIEIIQYKLDVLQRHQNNSKGIELETNLQRAQEELDAARLKELEQFRTDTQIKIQSEIVRLRELETELLSKESDRHRTVQSRISDIQMRLEQWEESLDVWNRLPPLDSSKKTGLFTLQRQIHQIQWELQEQVVQLSTVGIGESIDSPFEDEEVQVVLDSIQSVQTDTVKHIETEKEDLLRLWVKVHQKQDSVGYFEEENVQFWSDIVFEWQYLKSTVPINLTEASHNFRDVNRILWFLGQLLRWSIVGLIWVWIGRRVEDWWISFRQWLKEQDRPKMFDDVDFKVWEAPSVNEHSDNKTHLVQSLFFALSGSVLVQYLGDGWIEVFGSALLLWMFTKLCTPITEYLVSDADIRMPLRRGLLAFVWIYFGLNLLSNIFINILYLFQSVQIIQTIQWFALGLWGMGQLGVWYDMLHRSSMNVIGQQRLKEWMNRFSSGFLGRRVRTIVAICIILVDRFSKVLFWFVEHSSFFGSTLAKNTIENTEEETGEPFNTAHWDLDWSSVLRPSVNAIESDIQSAITEDGLVSGAMCLIADEGMGKSTVLKMVMEQSSVPTHLLKVEAIVRDGDWTVTKLLDWLCDGLNIPRQDSLENVCSAIEGLPNAIIGIDDMQRVFLRDVQGFEVINQLFYIIQATCGVHCWIVSCHRPTWTFWDSPSTPIRTEFFQHRYILEPWSVSEIRNVMFNMITEHKLSLNFSQLTTLNNPQALHRAEMAFWRLLTDSTKGNPSTSLQLFKQCAIRTPIEREVGIRMFSLRQADILNQLDDGSGFVLACVLMHNRFTLEEICNSLQMSQSVVVSICRQLVASSLLNFDEVHYQIDPIWFPWVEANLVQKRFIGSGERE